MDVDMNSNLNVNAHSGTMALDARCSCSMYPAMSPILNINTSALRCLEIGMFAEAIQGFTIALRSYREYTQKSDHGLRANTSRCWHCCQQQQHSPNDMMNCQSKDAGHSPSAASTAQLQDVPVMHREDQRGMHGNMDDMDGMMDDAIARQIQDCLPTLDDLICHQFRQSAIHGLQDHHQQQQQPHFSPHSSSQPQSSSSAAATATATATTTSAALFQSGIDIPTAVGHMHEDVGPTVIAPALIFNLALAHHLYANSARIVDPDTKRRYLQKAKKLYLLCGECLDRPENGDDEHDMCCAREEGNPANYRRSAGQGLAGSHPTNSGSFVSGAFNGKCDCEGSTLIVLALVNNLATLHQALGEQDISKRFFERLFVILIFLSSQGWDWDVCYQCRAVFSPVYQVFYNNLSNICGASTLAPAA